MTGLFQSLSYRAKAAARSAAVTAFGALFCIVGIGFLTAALWQVTAAAYGTLIATLVVGGAYLLTGLILILFSGGSRGSGQEHMRTPQAAGATDPEGSEPFFQMAQGFAAGMQAGRAARQGST